MVECRIDKLLTPAMARHIKSMLQSHPHMHEGALADMLEFVENNQSMLEYKDLQVTTRRGWLVLKWERTTITFYGGRRYNLCGYHLGSALEVKDFITSAT